MDREFVSDSLVYRYNPGASPDGLRGDEGTLQPPVVDHAAVNLDRQLDQGPGIV
jgi:hypothetical protein